MKMPAIVAKLHISSAYTAGVANTQAACGPRCFLGIFKY